MQGAVPASSRYRGWREYVERHMTVYGRPNARRMHAAPLLSRVTRLMYTLGLRVAVIHGMAGEVILVDLPQPESRVTSRFRLAEKATRHEDASP